MRTYLLPAHAFQKFFWHNYQLQTTYSRPLLQLLLYWQKHMMMTVHLHQTLNSFVQGPLQNPHARFFSRQLCPYTHGFSAGDTVGDKKRGLTRWIVKRMHIIQKIISKCILFKTYRTFLTNRICLITQKSKTCN